MIRFWLVIALTVLSTGCVMGRKKPQASLPMPPQPALTKPAPVLSIPPVEASIDTPAEPPVAVVAPPAPPAVVTRKPAIAPTRRPSSAPAVPVPLPLPSAPVSPGPEPGPQLREILTADKLTQYERDLAGSVRRARLALARAAGRRLTPPQRENVNRIQTFLKQAEASRKDDLGTALQLARRADLLGQDLLKSLLP